MAISRRSLPTQTTLFDASTLTCSSEEHPASHSPSLACGEGLRILVDSLRWPSSKWRQFFALGGSCGKMYPVSCQTMEDGRLEPSSEGWGSSGFGGPTESWTLDTSAWPKDVQECSLSAVLIPPSQVPKQYYLSPKACRGILRRAKERGKELPKALREALLFVAETEPLK